MPIDKGTSKPITQLSGLQINYKDQNSCFNPPIVTTEERNALVNTDDPTHPIKEGTMIYNSDEKSVQAYQNGVWVNVGGGDPVPNVVTSPEVGVEGNLVGYAGNDRTVKNSGLKIVELQQAKKSKAVNSTPLYKLSNLGALQFGSNENTADTGVILVDGLTPFTFQTQGTGADARVCTVINGELGAGSSSPSALLEINSTEGGFLHARMTTAQRDALLAPKDGLEIYNTDTKNLNIRQDSSWVEIKSGGNGNVIGPSVAINNNIPIFDGTSGTIIKDSGLNIDVLKNNTFKNIYTVVSHSGGGSFFLPNIDVCKITFIGNGGNGGKAVSGYKGCGGGSGGRLVVYLKNLLSIPDFQIRYSSGFDSRGCYMEIDANGYTPQVTFKADMGENGADGSSSVTSGGLGGGFSVVQSGTIYTADNYSYYGFQGVSGGVATNSGVSGYGGAGASGVVGNTAGLNGSATRSETSPITGGGGSGASGDGLPGGIGSYGMIIIEY